MGAYYITTSHPYSYFHICSLCIYLFVPRFRSYRQVKMGVHMCKAKHVTQSKHSHFPGTYNLSQSIRWQCTVPASLSVLLLLGAIFKLASSNPRWLLLHTHNSWSHLWFQFSMEGQLEDTKVKTKGKGWIPNRALQRYLCCACQGQPIPTCNEVSNVYHFLQVGLSVVMTRHKFVRVTRRVSDQTSFTKDWQELVNLTLILCLV